MYLPVDNRAEITINNILSNLFDKISKAKKIRDIGNILLENLPIGIAYESELILNISRNVESLENKKKLIKTIIYQSIAKRARRDNSSLYFSREDINKWYKASDIDKNFFPQPTSEIIKVDFIKNSIKTKFDLSIDEDQLVGISYGIIAIGESQNIRLISSITSDIINIYEIVSRYSLYRKEPKSPIERLKKPYQVEILDQNYLFVTTYFDRIEFMQGVISPSSWLGIAHNGENLAWKFFYRFTQEGLIETQI